VRRQAGLARDAADRAVGDPEQAMRGAEPDQALAILEQRAGAVAHHALVLAPAVPAAIAVAQHHAVGAGDPQRAGVVEQQAFGTFGAHGLQAPAAVAPDAALAGDPGRASGVAYQRAHLAGRQAQPLTQRL